MLNFPVAGGTSGHLVGSVLAAALLGPGAAVIALTAVLVVQCFVFADGGVLALGANIFNMGVVGALVGYALYRAVHRQLGGGLRGAVAAAAFASWVSTVLAAVCCAGELAVAGTVPWRVAFPAMAGVHMLIGVGEAADHRAGAGRGRARRTRSCFTRRAVRTEDRTSYQHIAGLRTGRGGGAGAVFVAVCQQAARRSGPRGRDARFCRGHAAFLGGAYPAGQLPSARCPLARDGDRAGRVARHGGGVFPGTLGGAFVDPGGARRRATAGPDGFDPMHAGLLESYRPRRSSVHRLPAGVKLAGALGLVLGSGQRAA